MPRLRRASAWLCLPPVVLCAADVCLTLMGQPAAYWAGDYSTAVEFNPVAWVFMAIHPLAFLLVVAGWMIAFCAVVARLTTRVALPFTFALALSHAVGGASWLWGLGPVGVVLAVAYLVAAERLVGLSWRRAAI